MFKAKLLPYNDTLPITNNSTERALHSKLDNFRFEQMGYFKLLDNGTYFYPAWKHYNRKTNVFCDRCNRQNLKACIGYANFDLCLLCIDELTRNNYDCPSRHCHESKFINDNSVDYSNKEYIDLNKIYYNQTYDIVEDGYKDDKIEGFQNLSKKHMTKKNIIIFIVIILVIYILYQ